MTHADTFKALIKVTLALIKFYISQILVYSRRFDSNKVLGCELFLFDLCRAHHRQAIISLQPHVALSDLCPANSSQEGLQDIVLHGAGAESRLGRSRLLPNCAFQGCCATSGP